VDKLYIGLIFALVIVIGLAFSSLYFIVYPPKPVYITRTVYNTTTVTQIHTYITTVYSTQYVIGNITYNIYGVKLKIISFNATQAKIKLVDLPSNVKIYYIFLFNGNYIIANVSTTLSPLTLSGYTNYLEIKSSFGTIQIYYMNFSLIIS